MSETLRDRCCIKRCRAESDMIYLGIGLCDHCYTKACQVYTDTTDYLLGRVIPEAKTTLERRIRARS